MKAKILMVEDDPEIARVVRDTLLRDNYEVTWATTGLEGLEDFKASSYDVVLVDLMLPEMDGFTLCQNIRWRSDVPIMIISAKKEDEDKVEGLQLGADDYLAKPFSIIELKARVESLLRRWRRYQGVEEISQKVEYLHGLAIDWHREKVFLHNQELSLTTKESELLKVLASNPHETFSKSELYQHVWQQADIEESHTVTVHIKSLREKLSDPVKNPFFIQTVWGKGYRFIGERS
ncbi:response regulator transcription factor [Mesobacillus maritimus]|uniref:response regulator transcription factor n=1 Tax=Mesobacillus maritimus TaxID=1643336 RepID=UPI00203FF350|nr:response regulator transcription factor [Mesobacillus maritimus]MCM3585580.1 response regulator transcription factor [Mesobacillus maritimus]MCM3669052.1 response regulator transcription factor [Mesobacillus maritimus]